MGREGSAGTLARARRASRAALAVAAVLTLACTMKRGAVNPGGDPMTITQDQITSLHAADAYQIVRMTHQDFLVSRGRESANPNVPAIPVDVYVDDTFYGDVNTLRNIPAEQVEEIRLYQSYEAQVKFGSGHMGGVIQVITKQ